MKIEIDPDCLRTSMTLWRQAVDMDIEVHTDFKIHFMTKRKSLLEGFRQTATSWQMVFRSNVVGVDADSQAQLDEVVKEILDFKEWADKGLADLHALSTDR